MARFFVPADQLTEDTVLITGEDVNHITRVLRLNTGDCITVSTGDSTEYLVEITTTSKTAVTGKVVQTCSVNREPELKVTLVQGLPKGDKMDLIIQKGTELGVSRIIPVETKRSVVKLEGKKAEQRVARWQRIAEEAAKQCRRNLVPEIAPLTNWSAVLASLPEGVWAVVPWEDEAQQSLKKLLQLTLAPTESKEVWVFIGPEGGIAPEEIVACRSRGVVPVTLGPRILRTETAGLAVLTMILFQWGDLGGSN